MEYSSEEAAYQIVTRSVSNKRRRLSGPRNNNYGAGKPIVRSQKYQDELLARSSSRLALLPPEILLAIFKYLKLKDLRAISRVASYFETIAYDLRVWKDYQVCSNKVHSSDIISDLKRIPKLKKMQIKNSLHSNKILRQISLSNKDLEELHISYDQDMVRFAAEKKCRTLWPGNLHRILEGCRRLHTLRILDIQCKGLKLYRLLGQALPRLREFTAHMLLRQFETFVENVAGIADKDRELLKATAQRRSSALMLVSYSVTKDRLLSIHIDNEPVYSSFLSSFS